MIPFAFIKPSWHFPVVLNFWGWHVPIHPVCDVLAYFSGVPTLPVVEKAFSHTPIFPGTECLDFCRVYFWCFDRI